MNAERVPGQAPNPNNNSAEANGTYPVPQSSSAGPYGMGAPAYWAAGWSNPLPIKGKQVGLPSGYSGYKGIDVPESALAEWLATRSHDNVCVRSNGLWVGIDVDAYDGRDGAATLAKAEAEYGTLPPTWTTTARGSGQTSGIRCFRIPVGTSLRGAEKKITQCGKNIEIVHRGHRYAMGWPSIHPEIGQVYCWYGPDGTPIWGVPHLNQLAELPASWLAWLTESALPAQPETPVSVTLSGTPALASDVRARVRQLARELADAADGNGNNKASEVAFKVGQYVGAGQIGHEEAADTLRDALGGWTYRTADDENRMLSTISRQLSAGAQSPRAWEAPSQGDALAGYEVRPLRGIASSASTPIEGEKPSEAWFTDAKMAEWVRREVLHDRFVWCAGLAWMAWDGRRWSNVPDATVREAMRAWAVEQYARATEAVAEEARSGNFDSANDSKADVVAQCWKKMLSTTKLGHVLTLLPGMVLRNAEDFDRHHDLLNTPDGVLNLATGQIGPHDPSLLITKITNVRYRPDARHEAFNVVLGAIPPGAHEWLQVRLGQAATGHMVDDHRMVLLSGGGSNGKTTLMETVFKALGGYAAAVPNSLLLTGQTKGAATPEKMTLRGVRLAYIEETPEDRYLDTQALKEVVGTPTVNGRELYKGFVTFGATHAIFLNTNHPPRVAETEEGTWRRLVRMDFPYRYRKPGEQLEKVTDKWGDPRLAARLQTPEAGEAALAWLVAGAQRWYQAQRTLTAFPDPDAVVDATKTWRHNSDVILRYIEERMVYDYHGWVISKAFYADFSAWLTSQGHKALPMNTLMDRVKSHTALPAYVGPSRVLSERAGRSDPPGFAAPATLPRLSSAITGLRYREYEE